MSKELSQAVTEEEVDVTNELTVIQSALDQLSLTGPQRRQVDEAFVGVLRGVDSKFGCYKSQQ